MSNQSENISSDQSHHSDLSETHNKTNEQNESQQVGRLDQVNTSISIFLKIFSLCFITLFIFKYGCKFYRQVDRSNEHYTFLFNAVNIPATLVEQGYTQNLVYAAMVNSLESSIENISSLNDSLNLGYSFDSSLEPKISVIEHEQEPVDLSFTLGPTSINKVPSIFQPKHKYKVDLNFIFIDSTSVLRMIVLIESSEMKFYSTNALWWQFEEKVNNQNFANAFNNLNWQAVYWLIWLESPPYAIEACKLNSNKQSKNWAISLLQSYLSQNYKQRDTIQAGWANYNLAALHEELNFYDFAYNYYQRAISKSENKAFTSSEFGRFLIKIGRAKEAVPILKKVILESPDSSASALFYLANAYMFTNDFESANECLLSCFINTKDENLKFNYALFGAMAMMIDTNQNDIYLAYISDHHHCNANRMSQIDGLQGLGMVGISTLSDCPQFMPNESGSYNLGSSLPYAILYLMYPESDYGRILSAASAYTKGDYQYAESNFNHLTTKYPCSYICNYFLAQVQFELNIPEWKLNLTRLLNGKYKEFIFDNIAQNYSLLDNKDSATLYFQKAIMLSKDSIPILKDWGMALFDMRDSSWQGKLEEALSIKPDHKGIRLKYSEMLNLEGLWKGMNSDEALALFNRAYIINPRNISALTNAADCSYNLRKYGDALALYQRVIELDTLQFSIYLKVGKLLKNEMGSANSSVIYFKKVLTDKISIVDLDARMELLSAYNMIGDLDARQKVFQEAYNKYTNPVNRENLLKAYHGS